MTSHPTDDIKPLVELAELGRFDEWLFNRIRRVFCPKSDTD